MRFGRNCEFLDSHTWAAALRQAENAGNPDEVRAALMNETEAG